MRTQLNGYVVGDEDQWLYDWFEIPAFSPKTVRDTLENAPDDEEVVFEINSGGGSVFAGFEMYSVLRNAKQRTVAEVQSIAASAASTVMLGCDEVQASPVAQVMIHLPLTSTDGNRYDHLESVNILDSLTESILNAYVLKCGGRATRDELKRLMRTSAWMTAPEAQGLGLVDTIIGQESIDPSAIINCAGGVSHGIRSLAAAPMPSAVFLRQRYEALVEEGKAPTRGTAPEKHNESALQLAKARLELEKIRF